MSLQEQGNSEYVLSLMYFTTSGEKGIFLPFTVCQVNAFVFFCVVLYSAEQFDSSFFYLYDIC